ncbi:MAG: glutaredoxin-related protein [Lachnospiraceae bacterium]|nr:glutaredoxin-related protein [Lachnospiraceae bacterium]
MIKIYGLPTCPYCDYVHEQVKGRESEFEYINIGEHVRNMKAFMHLRDSNPAFDHSKEVGDIGIPAFVREDGSITLDPADVGLVEFGKPNACSVEDHRSGKKGC